jgi:hypothetical protein
MSGQSVWHRAYNAGFRRLRFSFFDSNLLALTRRTAFGLALRGGAEKSATAGQPCEAFGFEGRVTGHLRATSSRACSSVG